MIKINLINPFFPKDKPILFPIREKDVGFLREIQNLKEEKKRLFHKQKLQPYLESNYEAFWKYAKELLNEYKSIFHTFDEDAFKKNFMYLLLYRDKNIQHVMNFNYGDKKIFTDALKDLLDKYCFPGEILGEPNPLPTAISSNLITTIYYFMTESEELNVPDTMVPYLLPVTKETISEKETTNKS